MFRQQGCTSLRTLLGCSRLLERSKVISSTIFIGNLSFDSTEDELRAVLVEIDPGVRVRLGKDKMTGKARGFAFAEFTTPTLAADAIKRIDGTELRNRRLRANDADDKPPPRAGGAPGGYSPNPGPRPQAPPSYLTQPPPFMDGDRFGGPPPSGGRRSGKGRRGGKRTLY